ncbi:MAG: hypothetical protein AAF330_05725, partial [Pseudomonadota bacterium]
MDDFEDDKDIYTTKALYEPDTGRFLYQTTLLNGLKHSPPDGSPSYISRNPQGSTWMVWHAFDKEHRTDGPSTVITHPNSDIPKTEALGALLFRFALCLWSFPSTKLTPSLEGVS